MQMLIKTEKVSSDVCLLALQRHQCSVGKLFAPGEDADFELTSLAGAVNCSL